MCVLCRCGSCGCCRCAVIWLAGTGNCCAGLLLLGRSVSLPWESSYCTALIKVACVKSCLGSGNQLCVPGLVALLSTTHPLQGPANASRPYLPDVGTRILVTLLHFHGPGLRARSFPSPKHLLLLLCKCKLFCNPCNQALDNNARVTTISAIQRQWDLWQRLEQGKCCVVSKGDCQRATTADVTVARWFAGANKQTTRGSLPQLGPTHPKVASRSKVAFQTGEVCTAADAK